MGQAEKVRRIKTEKVRARRWQNWLTHRNESALPPIADLAPDMRTGSDRRTLALQDGSPRRGVGALQGERALGQGAQARTNGSR